MFKIFQIVPPSFVVIVLQTIQQNTDRPIIFLSLVLCFQNNFMGKVVEHFQNGVEDLSKNFPKICHKLNPNT